MGRRLWIPLVVCVVALAAASVAVAELSQSGNLRISFDGGFSPQALPRDRAVPVTVHVEGRISTTDGSHPPPVKRLEIELNRSGRIDSRGLPRCSGPALQSTSSEAALERCRDALVGRGNFRADLEFGGEPLPASGPILAFNSQLHGRPALLLHLFISAPARLTFILPLTISHQARGQFGTVLSARVPKLAGGLGSVTQISLDIGRTWNFEGRRHGYISAACAAPAGFPGAIFPFARASFVFAGARTLDTTLTRDCRVR